MKVYYLDAENIEKYKDIFKNKKVIAMGFFDGVHLGHKKILTAAKDKSLDIKAELDVLTYQNHPVFTFGSLEDKKNFKYISSLKNRLKLFKQNGVDKVFIVTKTHSFFKKSSEDFINGFLLKLKPSLVVAGFNHTFGKNKNIDNIDNLYAISNGRIKTMKIPPFKNNDGKVISSTKIREYIKRNDFNRANKMLGYNFFSEGKIIKGQQLGRKIGFNTANFYLSNYLVYPSDGVYATFSKIDKDSIIRHSMTSVGSNPTVNDNEKYKVIETNIFDFDSFFYNKNFKIYWVKKIRDQEKFSNISSLKMSLTKDKINIEKILKKV